MLKSSSSSAREAKRVGDQETEHIVAKIVGPTAAPRFTTAPTPFDGTTSVVSQMRPARAPQSGSSDADALVQKIAVALGLTTMPPAAAQVTALEPLYVRVTDLRWLAGLKRGFTYTKMKDGTFKNITLREPGKKFGVRLVYWPSVKAWLHGRMQAQNQVESEPTV